MDIFVKKKKVIKLKEEVVLITYSEIGIKGKQVRRTLEQQLARNIRSSLKQAAITDAKIRRIQGRLIIEGGKPEEILKIASKVFGVTSAIYAVKISAAMDTIVQEALDTALQCIKDNQTFAIRARRVGN
ncbi:THUMP domain-containing protein, partial [Candidatus Bathyarchaeota archaeon]|nr:THUMP domain-containing protein [Candidatus Bathyarchaeota archaeon]